MRQFKTKQLTLTAMMTAFVFVATFVPKIPIPFALGRRGKFFSGDVLRAANWNFKRNNRFGIGRFLEWLSDMDYTDDFNQGAEAEIFWRLRGKSFLLGLILSSLAMTAGYTFVGAFLYDSLNAGLASTPGLLLKSAVNIFVAIILRAAIKKSRW